MRKESFGKIILFTTTGMPNQVKYEQRGCGKVSSGRQIANGIACDQVTFIGKASHQW
jgi:hypothetical protein